MVTDVVKLRTLIGGANRHFHHPPCHFGEKSVLQTSGLSERVSVFGRFMAYQILPNFTNFYQKCVAKGGRRGSKRQLTGGLLRAIYLNRVKSCGSCQAVTGAAWFQNRRKHHGGARVPRVKPGRGHGSCLELFRAKPALECGSLGLSCRLAAKGTEQPLRGSPGATGCRTTFSGFVGRLKRGEADPLIRQGLLSKWPRRTEGRLAQSKGLANPVSAERSGDLFGLCRMAETWRGLSADSAVVVGQVSEENRRRLAQSQGLVNRFSAEA